MTQFGDFNDGHDCERGDCCTIGRKVTRPKKLDTFGRAFGHQIQLARVRLDLTQKQAADRAGIPYQTLGYYERGEKIPLVTTAARVCRALGIDPAELMRLID